MSSVLLQRTLHQDSHQPMGAVPASLPLLPQRIPQQSEISLGKMVRGDNTDGERNMEGVIEKL